MADKKIATLLKSGVKQDPKDERDYIFTEPHIPDNIVLADTTSLPSLVDHTPKMSSVKFQGQLGSCVGFASVAVKEWQELIEHEREVSEGKKDHRRGQEYNLSEQWVYYNCKKIDPWPNEEGTNLRSAMKVLNKIGVPTEKAWPYDPIKVGSPKQWAPLIARWYVAGSYWRIEGLENIKKALIEGPITIGMTLFDEIYGNLEHGIIPYPANPNNIAGYHAVCAVGYDDDRQLLKFKNSWSIFWGEGGYGYIPYSYVRDFVWDAWIMRDVSVTKEMLKGTVSLIEEEAPSPLPPPEEETTIEIEETPLIPSGTKKHFLFMGFKAEKSIDPYHIAVDVFGIPAEEIAKAAKKVGVLFMGRSGMQGKGAFCAKYFAEMRKEGEKTYNYPIDVLKEKDDFCREDNIPIIGICLKEQDTEIGNIEYDCDQAYEIAGILKSAFNPEAPIKIYKGIREY